MSTNVARRAVLRAVPADDPSGAARHAGLRHVDDRRPGLRRLRRGKLGGRAGAWRWRFAYVDPRGRAVRDAATLERIRKLAIPPAWRDVWICADPAGHLQATGRDARGRKQYRYHPRWRVERDSTKYARLAAFGAALPALRRRVAADLRLPGLPRRKLLAVVVRLLETTFIRVGNEAYARENGSFGLTTLHDRHVELRAADVEFHFRGKSGVFHRVTIHDPRVARVVRRCRDLPGHTLFQYLDASGRPVAVDSADVNAYIHEIAGEAFTAKDFRTWAGTVLAAQALGAGASAGGRGPSRAQVTRAVARVAARLGNTPAVCRKCYIHPRVLASYLDGTLTGAVSAARGASDARGAEAAVLALLRRRERAQRAAAALDGHCPDSLRAA